MKNYQTGDHVVKTEGERKGGVIIEVKGEEGVEQKVKWGDGSITPIPDHIAPAKEYMS